MAAPAVLDEGFWTRPKPDPARRGDAEQKAIFCAVGEALSEWEGVEEKLGRLFTVLARATRGDAELIVFRAFGAIETTTGRLNALRSAAEMYFHVHWERSEITREFNRLGDAIVRASHRRNEIAHGKTKIFRGFTHVGVNGSGPLYDDKGIFLVPAAYKVMHNDFVMNIDVDNPRALFQTRYFFTSADIHVFADKFKQLAAAVKDYTSSIAPHENGLPMSVHLLLEAGRQKARGRKAQRLQEQELRPSSLVEA